MNVKKMLSLIICLAITAGMFIIPSTVQAEDAVWDGTADYSWYDDKTSPYEISTPAQFAAFANIVNRQKEGYDDRFAGKTIKLMADLDMGDKPFRAIGGSAKDSDTGVHDAFAGTFEGNGHIIRNLKINQLGYKGSKCAGLFACVRNGNVNNLGLENVTVEVPAEVTYQGAFVGYVLGETSTTIKNCFVRNVNINVTTPIAGGRIGGFAGYVSNAPTEGNVVSNCYSVNVNFSVKSGDNNVGNGFGHFAGLTDNNAKFINCYSGGVIQLNDSKLPGKVLPFGMINGTTVTNCYSDCSTHDKDLTGWFLLDKKKGGAGYTRGGTEVPTANLKGMTGNVVLGTGFVKAENDSYNYGYPFLKWEEKYIEDIRQPRPTGAFEIKSKEDTENQPYSVTVTDLGADVEYRYVLYGKAGEWQGSNVFTDLLSGKYTFEARTKGNAEKYPSKEITTDEISVGSLSVSVWNGEPADYSWYDGKESPYTISTAAQFMGFANIVNHTAEDGYKDTFAGKTINLAADLDMGSKSFSAIGGSAAVGQAADDRHFGGTFNGNGHIIKNLYINKLGYDGSVCAGLFACVRAAQISNLGLENVKLEISDSTVQYQGAFVGYVAGNTSSTIENCFARDVNIIVNELGSGGKIGGFAGYVSPWNTSHAVKNCYSVNVQFGTTLASDKLGHGFGHFAGASEGEAKFSNCYSGAFKEQSGDIKDRGKLLSFGMYKGDTKVTNCYSDCNEATNNLAWFFKPTSDNGGGFTNAVSKIDTAKLKGMTALGEAFVTLNHDFYNYGYPILTWEADRAEALEDPTQMFEPTAEYRYEGDNKGSFNFAAKVKNFDGSAQSFGFSLVNANNISDIKYSPESTETLSPGETFYYNIDNINVSGAEKMGIYAIPWITVNGKTYQGKAFTYGGNNFITSDIGAVIPNTMVSE